jgi:20S proteasome alpha/beta subunit
MVKQHEEQEEESMVDLCERMLGSEIDEIAVDSDNEIVYIYTSNGMIQISGDDLRMYVSCDKFDD